MSSRYRLLEQGPPPDRARAVVVLVHGRGGSARDMLALGETLGRDDVAWLAPEATAHTWYPLSFLASLEANEPHLSASLGALDGVVRGAWAAGAAPERTVVLGFSQGACLTLEWAARNARRLGGVVGLTGGVIGPPEAPREYEGSFAGTPVLLASGDPDPHVPFSRVEATARIFEGLGAQVDLRRYPGRPHTVSHEEILLAGRLLERVTRAADGSSW